MFNKKKLLGIEFTLATEEEVLEYIITGLEKSAEKYYVVTPNPELLVIANKNTNYKKVLNGAKLALPDGVGVMIAGQLLGKQLKQKITGVDLMKKICERVAEKPITIGFLGAGPGVAEKAAECLVSCYPGLKVVFVNEEWEQSGFERAKKYQEDEKNNKSGLNAKYKIHNTIDILFVAFGSPKQELWIAENLEKLPVKVAIGVGGSFDFISGKVKRAPEWMRKIGLEWLFRLIIQPWRIKRQFSLVIFSLLVFKEMIAGRSSE